MKYYSPKMGGIVLNTKKGGIGLKSGKKGGIVLNSRYFIPQIGPGGRVKP